MPKKPTDPHTVPAWILEFNRGLKDCLEGREASQKEGHYWHGYKYGLAILEKEREKKAKEEKKIKIGETFLAKKGNRIIPMEIRDIIGNHVYCRSLDLKWEKTFFIDALERAFKEGKA